MKLNGKRILLIVTGGIAAYKTPSLVRNFIKLGAEVRVVLTPAAKDFVSPMSLSVVSKNEVISEFVKENQQWNAHVEAAHWAEVIIVAPCTANTLAKMIHGICDNYALATYMSAKCPVFIAPAMDLEMYQHPSTHKNLLKATEFGHHIIPAEFGELASGLVGQGRLASEENILSTLETFFLNEKKPLTGKKILITAGPTYEAIDPVRFIGNHSSGKMGFALAKEAANRGAEVFLVTGPTVEKTRHSAIKIFPVVSANEMYDQVFQYFAKMDVCIASAAVADYKPKEIALQKIKKNEEAFSLELEKTTDILKEMGHQKQKQILIGFALETENEEENAKAKLNKKNLDIIVLNSLKDKGAGFKTETNKIKIITQQQTKEFQLKNKTEVAKDILDTLQNEFLKS